MAITTMAGVIAGLQPVVPFTKSGAGTPVVARPFSLWYVGGSPGGAAVPSSGLAGAALSAPVTGQMPFLNPVSGNAYLARFSAIASQTGSNPSGSYILCDRLWQNSGISVTTTGAQTINSVAWPARDNDGSTNGEGVRIGLELSTATGAGASVVSISYTDQGGTAGATGACMPAYAASSAVNSFYTFSLEAGDTGVRSIQSYTSTVSMSSGVVHLVAYRVLARLAMSFSNGEVYLDAVTGGMPRLYNDSVPFLLYMPGNTNGQNPVHGQILWTHG